MSTWHVWGDYVHTIPETIGEARRESVDSAPAKRTAVDCGFDFDGHTRNGFEPWAAVFSGGEGESQSFAFAAFGTVRGWRRV